MVTITTFYLLPFISYEDANFVQFFVITLILISDMPQPCYQIWRSCRYGPLNHRFTTDAIYSKWTAYSQEFAYGTFFGLTSYVDSFTTTVYEMYIPPSGGYRTVFAYGNGSYHQLLSLGYSLKQVAFYLPAVNLTGTEVTVYHVWNTFPPTDSMFVLVNEKNNVINTGWTLKETALIYDTSTVCSSISYDCNYTDWTPWSVCSVSCGTGQQLRNRTLIFRAVGRNCSNDITNMTQNCRIIIPCPIDCSWNNWEAWGSCDTSCLRQQNRSKLVVENYNGSCSGNYTNSEQNCGNCVNISQTLLVDTGINVTETLTDSMSLISTIQDSTPYFLSSLQLDDSEKLALGAQLKDNIKTCIYDGNFCNMDRDFKTKLYPSLGNCFTFNYHSESPYNVRRAGALYGLTVLLNSSQQDYLCSSYQTGFRLKIHNSSVYPFVDNEGYYVSPGYTTSVYVMKVRVQSLTSPYGDCISNENQIKANDYFYSGSYSIEGCYRSCYQKQVILTCGCADPRYAIQNGATFCPIAKKRCVTHSSDCVDFDWSSCNCRRPCHDESYSQTITLSQLENSAFLLQYCTRQTNTSLADCLNYAKKDFAVLTISFKNLNSYYYEEQPAYNIFRLLSDFSGVTGLLLGVCVITIPEVLLLFFMCCSGKYCMKKK